MSMDQRDADNTEGMGALMTKTLALFVAWLGTWGLADLQILVGICSGLIFAGYTVSQCRALNRKEKTALAHEAEDAQNRRDEAQDRRDEARDHRNR